MFIINYLETNKQTMLSKFIKPVDQEMIPVYLLNQDTTFRPQVPQPTIDANGYLHLIKD
jgi:hypothetical protein